MPYTPTTWNEGVAPGISAAQLNRIEAGVDLAVGHAEGDNDPHAIADLSDVTITAVGGDEVLGYSGGWINRTLAEAGIATASHTHTHAATTGQTTDDHHAQVHAIGGADHTGSLAHSDLASVGASDHHTKYTDTEAAAKIAADDLYVKNAGDAMTGQLLADFGSSSLPGVAFDGDSDTGIYRSTTNRLGIVAGGSIVALFQSGLIRGDSTTGSMFIRSTAAGSVTAPTYTFEGDTNTGMYRSAATEIGFATGGTKRAHINSTGIDVAGAYGFTNTAPPYISEGWGLRFNGGSTQPVQVATNAAFTVGITPTGTPFTAGYMFESGWPTTGSSGNAYLALASGSIYYFARSTSTRRHKSKIDYGIDDRLADYKLKPAKFYRKDDKAWSYGLIAEDVAGQDELLAVYDDDGKVENFHDRGVLAVVAAKLNRIEAAAPPYAFELEYHGTPPPMGIAVAWEYTPPEKAGHKRKARSRVAPTTPDTPPNLVVGIVTDGYPAYPEPNPSDIPAINVTVAVAGPVRARATRQVKTGGLAWPGANGILEPADHGWYVKTRIDKDTVEVWLGGPT